MPWFIFLLVGTLSLAFALSTVRANRRRNSAPRNQRPISCALFYPLAEGTGQGVKIVSCTMSRAGIGGKPSLESPALTKARSKQLRSRTKAR